MPTFPSPPIRVYVPPITLCFAIAKAILALLNMTFFATLCFAIAKAILALLNMTFFALVKDFLCALVASEEDHPPGSFPPGYREPSDARRQPITTAVDYPVQQEFFPHGPYSSRLTAIG
jgi:hypothetical protein